MNPTSKLHTAASSSSSINYTSSPSTSTATTTTTTTTMNSVEKTTIASAKEMEQFLNATGSTFVDNALTHLTASTMNEMESLNVTYVASEATVALLAIVGNLLVVYVFCTNRSLRRYRNYYIVGLAVADFLVGLLGIPLAVLASVGLPRHLYGCLFTVSILMVLCTVSILCLVAVSIDRYWATTNPFAYYRNMTTTTAVGIILTCWFVGAIIGFLPLFGWYNHQGWDENYCIFVKVMDYNYLVFLYFATIIFPAILMACFYGYIYHIVLIKIRQKGTLAPQGGIRRPSEASRSGSLNSDLRGSTTQMMRIIVSEKRREAKAAKKLSIIVLFFMICWMPLYTINCVQAFCTTCSVPQQLLDFTIILSHANSALNPFLYAYHLKEFRIAMKNVLCSCFSCLMCGCFANAAQKDSSAVSRSQTMTMPSIGNHHIHHTPNNNTSTTSSATTTITSAAKHSIKFRKVIQDETNFNGVNRRAISPDRARRLMSTSTPSRDNLLSDLKINISHNQLDNGKANKQVNINQKINNGVLPQITTHSSDDSSQEEQYGMTEETSITTANVGNGTVNEGVDYSSDNNSTLDVEDSNQGKGNKSKSPSLRASKDLDSSSTLAPPSPFQMQTKSLSFSDHVEIGF